MTRKPDEIKRGLECCSSKKPCLYCPMWDECKEARGLKPLFDNTLAYIRQLEAERDALMNDMNRSCFICKHFCSGEERLKRLCAECVRWCNWEWRGVPKEE